MDSLSFKTIHLNAGTTTHEWIVVDATNVPLGRLSSHIAMRLRGKHKPGFTPHMDCGDRVIVINAERVKLTGNKAQQRPFIWHTGYPGGQRQRTPAEYLSRGQGERIIENAVRRMLPKNRLGRKLYTNLYVYKGAEHPHEAQAPTPIEFKL